MNTNAQVRKTRFTPGRVAVGSTVLLFLSLAVLVWLQSVNFNLNEALSGHKTAHERTLGEKAKLEHTLQQRNAELAGLTAKNGTLSGGLAESNASLTKALHDAEAFRATKRRLSELQDEKSAIVTMYDKLKKDWALMSNSLDGMVAENSRLREDNRRLLADNARMGVQMDDLTQAVINNSLVQAVQGKKEKVTIRAKRVNSLRLEADLPASMGSIALRVIGPDGKELTMEHGTVMVEEILTDQFLTASADETVGAIPNTKRIRLEFLPKRKLEKGIYTMDVMSGGKSLGSTKTKLR